MKPDIVLISSIKDPASINIRDLLIKKYNPERLTDRKINGFTVYRFRTYNKLIEIITISSDLIYAEELNKRVNGKLFIFLSRHKSEEALPTLTAHVPGNWLNTAPYGGRPKDVCIAPAKMLSVFIKALYRERSKLKLDDWKCSLEATHHGPYIEEVPTMFVEIGSSIKEWTNKTAAEAIVNALDCVFKADMGDVAAIGIGGPHYAPKITKFVLEENIPVGHIIPKYVTSHIGDYELNMAIEKTFEDVKYAVIDWKGIRGTDRRRIIDILRERYSYIDIVKI